MKLIKLVLEVQDLIAWLIVGVLSLGMHPHMPNSIRGNIIELVDRWASLRGTRYRVAWHMQAVFQKATGYERCGYCQWLCWPGKRHDACEETRSLESDPGIIHCSDEEPSISARQFHAMVLDELAEIGDLPEFYGDDDYCAELEASHDNDLCPCGHPLSAHAHDKHSQCYARGCNCPAFSMPVEEWDPPTKVYLGDMGDDMGVIGWE